MRNALTRSGVLICILFRLLLKCQSHDKKCTAESYKVLALRSWFNSFFLPYFPFFLFMFGFFEVLGFLVVLYFSVVHCLLGFTSFFKGNLKIYPDFRNQSNVILVL